MKSVGLSIAAIVVLVTGFLAGFLWPRGDSGEPGDVAFGTVDVGFAQDMTVHHLQAIELCNALPAEIDAMLANLCTQIHTTQTKEIGMMSGWLELLDHPLASREPMTWMAHDHHDHDHHRDLATPRMPGMASWQELGALRHAAGTDAEVQFLQLMIRHHQGGLEMAGYAAEHATAPAVRRLATSMLKEQSQETAVMEHLLRQRDAVPLPYP